MREVHIDCEAIFSKIKGFMSEKKNIDDNTDYEM